MAKVATKRANANPQFVPVSANANNAPVGNGMGDVTYMREELGALLETYEIIRDCIDGQKTVKLRRDKYLPIPNSADKSADNVERYNAYVLRAVFYNVVKRTLAGLVGQVFMQPPVIEVPPLLDAIVKDANGSGISLEQLAKDLETFVVAYGRGGILADFPKTSEPTTRAQQLAGDVRPTMTVYEPWNIINWRTMLRGGRLLLSLVVLRELYDKTDDGFETKQGVQYRVLRLVDNVYQVQIWREDAATTFFGPVADEAQTPADAQGKPLDEIPFKFVGVENNDAMPDAAPMYDLATLNIAHYRNSADYEESVFMLGQPTPWFAGLTEGWVSTVMKGVVALGSRAAIPLPVGGTAGLLQALPNTMAFEAMEHKERQMVSLGAKLVEQKTVQRTATEAGLESASETSTLTTATKNVSAAILWALEWCGIFAGAITMREDTADTKDKKIKFELNTEFEISKMAPDQITATIESWIKEAITTAEMRKRLRQTGLAYLDDDDYEKEIQAAQPQPGDVNFVETRFDANGNPLPPVVPGAPTPPLPTPPGA